MSVHIRIARRSDGSATAPTSLLNAELAFVEVNDVLYYGKGTGGVGGSATTVIPIGGSGAFVTLGSTQIISGDKTYTGNVSLGSLAVAATPATTENSNRVATTQWVKSLPIAASTASYITVNSESGLENERNLTGSSDILVIDNGANNSIVLNLSNTTVAPGTYQKVTVDAKGRITAGSALQEADIPVELARTASPTFTGVPTAPTAVLGTNSNQLATTSFVKNALDDLIGSAPGTLDTLNEIATALGNDPNFATTITTSIASKLSISSNLGDLADPILARQNLGVEIGVNVQAQNATLDSISGLVLANNTGFYATGVNTIGTYALTSYARTVLGSATAADMRTAIGLGTMAVQNSNNVAITGGTIDNIELDGGVI